MKNIAQLRQKTMQTYRYMYMTQVLNWYSNTRGKIKQKLN